MTPSLIGSIEATMVEPRQATAEDAITETRLLAGHVAERRELAVSIQEHLGLIVLAADPLSGTSTLLEAGLRQSGEQYVRVDARRCADMRDLAMAIADAAVGVLAPEALAWWQGSAPPASADGLRLGQMLQDKGIAADGLLAGTGQSTVLLRRALDLTAGLASGHVELAIDHLGAMLASMRENPGREILDALRSGRQRNQDLGLVLIDQPRGRIVRALHDRNHPMYRAGATQRIARPTPDRVIHDLSTAGPIPSTPVGVIRAAAELAAGVPSLTWQVVELAGADGDVVARAMDGWQRLRRFNATSVSQQWDQLRRIHSSAQMLITAISLNLRPHSVPAASKTVDDGLNRLRDVGVAWQPAERMWAVADPLLAASARELVSPWAVRRLRGATTRAA
jgi:hypothetical protein